jgi:anaerobic nitric oxide reductase flavorubredoxin
MKWDFLESVEFEGAPKEEDLNKIEERVLELINKMKDKVVE